MPRKSKWMLEYVRNSSIPGWHVKESNMPYTPVAVISEPIGGKKTEYGVSDRSEKIANLIVAAPELLAACEEALGFFGDDPDVKSLATGVRKLTSNLSKAIHRAKGGR